MPLHGMQMLELGQNGDHQQDGRSKFDEVTKMWSAMSEEAKRAYTEDFKVRSRCMPSAAAGRACSVQHGDWSNKARWLRSATGFALL